MVVEFLKFIVNNVLKSNNRLEKKKSKLFVRKKKSYSYYVFIISVLKFKIMM